MTVSYEIILTIINLTDNTTQTFTKSFDFDINVPEKDLYNNYYLIANNVKMFSLFKPEINNYCYDNKITINNIDIDEFNINSLTDRVDVYFESDDELNQISLEPNIKCYVLPKHDALEVPELSGKAYDDHTIIWSWEDDGQAHYILSEACNIEDEEDKDKIIAQIPIGTCTYTETGLDADTSYTRRLIAYNSEQTSGFSRAATVQTATAPIDQSLEQYQIEKNYDYTSDDSEREIVQERLDAFHSGVGDYNDLKVYKQMDADFYQKFKTYIQLRGARTQREKRYDSVGFNYKVCLEAEETVEEQKGEVTFDIDVYPREYVSIKDYMYSTQPVTICSRMWCDVLLKMKNDHTDSVSCNIKEPSWERGQIPNEKNKRTKDNIKVEARFGNPHIILCIDVTKSLNTTVGSVKEFANLIKNCISKIKCDSWSVVIFGGIANSKQDSAYVYKHNNSKFFNKEKANETLDSIGNGDASNKISDLSCTCWSKGLEKSKNCKRNNHQNILIFCTDGPDNTMFDGRVVSGSWGMNTDMLVPDIRNHMDSGYEYIGAFIYKYPGPIPNQGTDHITYPSSHVKATTKAIIEGYNNNKYDIYSWENKNTLDNKINDFLKIFNVKEHYEWPKGTDAGNKPYHTSTNKVTNKKYELPNGNPTDKKYHTADGTGTDEANSEGGWSFKGWKDTSQSINVNVNYDIDELRWAHVVIPPMSEDPWTCEISNDLTPIIYARNEQRAIIPSDSIIYDRNFDPDNAEYNSSIRQEAIKLDNRSIQSMILDAVTETEVYQEMTANGEVEIVQAYTPDEIAKGEYIIRGLFIKDSYKYADEDTIPSVIFGEKDLEDGYTGTLNVYTDINKLDSSDIGDDIYTVSDDNYVWLSGYTDAIIYDGERIESVELNASHAETYDHQEEILISPIAEYGQLLWNRKNRNIRYSGANNIVRHCIDVIDKDKDVYLTGCDVIKNIGDWALFVPSGTDISDTNKIIRGTMFPIIEFIMNDIIAHNDEHYQSPILNYRFSIEDPDAYTCYYELLPTCDPYSKFKNIVMVHIYYANNINIQDEERLSGSNTQYIASFGDSNIATRSSRYYQNSSKIKGQTYFREEYIDDYIWFKASPMTETRPYYDEKPNPGMDSFYGNVNGRYREGNKSGKFDLRVLTPQFNLPTTIDANNIKIYIMISEFYPDTALVAYKWEHPLSQKDSITKVNGDYVIFSSDSLTYKDVVYNELIQTITSENIELFDNKTTTKHFFINKPLSRFVYDNYYIELVTNNADVLPLNYPTEIKFDENDRAEFGANFKGVVNATTKWSPRIHNGYYYINQHEYYAYSEFNVEADFEEYNDENYKNLNGYLTIDVDILRKAGPSEHYDIVKNTRSELIQNEKEFRWVDGKGLTVSPVIDGEYYKEYTAREYISPVLLFPNSLTSAGRIKVDYYFEDGSPDFNIFVRSYDIENGVWSEWSPFSNGAVPSVPLSCGYQVKFTMMATVINHDKTLEDYLCCHLDWVDDGDEDSHVNIVTITDHLKSGPDKGNGVFFSKIIDFGCSSTITLDMFESNINSKCELYIATEQYNKDKLLLENIKWTKTTGAVTVTTRFFRYKIVVPYGEKLYWLHKKILTKESEVTLPYVTAIKMIGDYIPQDTHDLFQEIQSFEILSDGMSHRIFPSIYDIISSDIREKGYLDSEIHYVRINSTENNIHLNFDSGVTRENPSITALNTPIYATADFETEINVKNTPYIYSNMNPIKNLDVITIRKGTPQQYCPITMEDDSGVTYKEVFDVDSVTLQKTEKFEVLNEDNRHYIKLARNDYDIKTLTLELNEVPFDNYQIKNNLIIFNNLLNINDILIIKYKILNSFYTEIDYDNDKTQITVYSDYDSEIAKQEEKRNLVPITTHDTYTECYLNQIYANGTKLMFNANSKQQDNNWKYDAGLNAIYYPENNNYFSIITHDLLPSANYQMTVIAYSNDKDGDVIGFVIGSVKDSGGTLHTLCYLISLSSDYLFNGSNTGIVMDYGTNNAIVISSKTIEHVGFDTWKDMPNGIKIYVKKNKNILQCKISNWNRTEEWNADSLIEYDLDSNTDTKLFNQVVSYGFCCISQQDTYFVEPSFIGKIDKTITVEEQVQNLRHKYKVYFETNKTNNKFIADKLSLNPVYRTDYKGFIYLTDDHNEPYKINIYRNPKYIKAGGYDKIDVVIEVLDYEDNPVISKDIDIDCSYGILNFDDTNAKHLTDMNGVVHVIYESSVSKCVDTLTARTLTSDGKIIQSSVEIVNE